MIRDERFIKLALKIAETSQHNFPMGAVIVIGNRIMGVGVNKYRTHPQQINSYTKINAESIHAELSAIISSSQTKGATIYIARIRMDGSWGMAKPCACCSKILEVAEIKRVVYTNDNKYEVMEL